MKVGICSVVVLMGVMGIVANAAAVPENNSGLATLALQQPSYLLKTCEEFSSGGGGGVDPAGSLAVYLGNRSNRDILDNPTALNSIKIILLEDTKHGKLTAEVDNRRSTSYHYAVELGYLGKDKAVFMTEFEGKRYKVVVNFVITEGIDENSPQCPPGDGTLIKLNPTKRTKGN